MTALEKPLVAVEFLRKLRGGSQSILVRADDGFLYVAKFLRNLQGPNLLFNEAMGTELFRAYGLSVPEWRPILVNKLFLDRNSACWFETESGRVRPEPGLCFASRFLGGAADGIWEILPGSYFRRVSNRMAFGLAWLLDVCARHSDNRQAVFVRAQDGNLRAVFIDHGGMFGGPCGTAQPPPICSRYLDPRIYEDMILGFRRESDILDEKYLWDRLRALPADWRSASAIEQFSACIRRLTDPASISQVCQAIVDLCRRDSIRDEADSRRVERIAEAVLCAGLRRPRTLRRELIR